jgi:hypothetical protein
VDGTSKYRTEIEALGEVLSALSNLDDDGRQFVMRAAADRLGLVSAGGTATLQPPPRLSTAGVTAQASPHAGSTVDPKHFMDQKRPNTDVERVTCLAYYLNHHRGTPHFKTADISALNTEAAQPALSNTSFAVGNAEKAGYVATAGRRGSKQITAYGEKVVNALPEPDAVKEVIAAEKRRHARRKANRNIRKKDPSN